MAAPSSQGEHPATRQFVPRMTQPEEMKTKSYVYGVDKLNGYDTWAMFKASAGGDVAKVKALLTKDPRLVNAQCWYQFPIHMALFAGNVEIVKLLLDRGADPGQSIFTYNSWDKLLSTARERGYRQIESLLLKAMQKRFNYSPDFDALKDVIIARDSRRINAVLRRQANLVQVSDALGNNALHWAVITRQLSLIERFVELGTPIDALRADGQTPVLLVVNCARDYWYRANRSPAHPSLRDTSILVGSLLAHGATYTISVAAAVGDQERVDELLRKDGSLARRLDTARISPLSYAAREGHLHIVRMLLERGAAPNQPEEAASQGRALYEACCANRLEVARLLLEHGANPNSGMDSSECCLTIGKLYHGDQAKPLQELLRQYGAYTPPYRMSVQQMKQAILDRHEVTRDGEFLICMIRKRNTELLNLYFDADPTVVDRIDLHGEAISVLPVSMIQKLLQRGLDPNCPDWTGRTYLHTCAENGDRSRAALLLDAGADINVRDLEFRETPLAAAIRCCPSEDQKQLENCRRMVQFLLKRGVAISLPDDEPWATPLAWARKRSFAQIEQILLKHETN